MKALLIADVHSNPFALEAIWRHEGGADAVYCAGDLVDYGPFPNEAVDWIRDHRALCVVGNHDQRVLACLRDRGAWERLPPAQRKWKHHNAALLRPDLAAYLADLPAVVEFDLAGVPHGMTHSYLDYQVIQSLHAFETFLADRFGPPAPARLRRLVLGHTHRQGVHLLSDQHAWINPGSVSYRRPDDPDQTAHYITVTEGRMELHRLAYDLTPLLHECRRHQLHPDEMLAGERFFGPPARAALPTA